MSEKSPHLNCIAQERYHQTLDGLLEGCQIIDHDWRYLYINQAAARHGHRTPEELLHRTMMEAYPGIETSELFSILKRCMQERTNHQMENRFEYPDGSAGWFELSIQPVPDGLFILSMDITAHKLSEMKTKRQLARINALRKIDLAVLSSFDLQLTLTVSIDQIMEQLDVDTVDVMLLDAASSTLTYAAGRGFRQPGIERARLRLGEAADPSKLRLLLTAPSAHRRPRPIAAGPGLAECAHAAREGSSGRTGASKGGAAQGGERRAQPREARPSGGSGKSRGEPATRSAPRGGGDRPAGGSSSRGGGSRTPELKRRKS